MSSLTTILSTIQQHTYPQGNEP